MHSRPVRDHNHCEAHPHSIIELCSEREEFFIPGDPDPKRTEDYEDFDDL